MMANGLRIRRRERESTYMRMGLCMMDFGRTTSKMGKGKKNGQMDHPTKANTREDLNTDKEPSRGQTQVRIRENLKTT